MHRVAFHQRTRRRACCARCFDLTAFRTVRSILREGVSPERDDRTVPRCRAKRVACRGLPFTRASNSWAALAADPVAPALSAVVMAATAAAKTSAPASTASAGLEATAAAITAASGAEGLPNCRASSAFAAGALTADPEKGKEKYGQCQAD